MLKMSFTEEQVKRFFSKVKKTESCWFWTAGRTKTGGYGHLTIKSKQYMAHRISWMIHFGEIPKGNHHGTMCVLHRCDNTLCVNPSHLFLGSQKDNMRDAKVKGRKYYGEHSGEQNGRAKMTVKDVLRIRSLVGRMTRKEISKSLNIPYWRVNDVVTRKTWINI